LNFIKSTTPRESLAAFVKLKVRVPGITLSLYGLASAYQSLQAQSIGGTMSKLLGLAYKVQENNVWNFDIA
jgi:hypothetical protein